MFRNLAGIKSLLILALVLMVVLTAQVAHAARHEALSVGELTARNIVLSDTSSSPSDYLIDLTAATYGIRVQGGSAYGVYVDVTDQHAAYFTISDESSLLSPVITANNQGDGAGAIAASAKLSTIQATAEDDYAIEGTAGGDYGGYFKSSGSGVGLFAKSTTGDVAIESEDEVMIDDKYATTGPDATTALMVQTDSDTLSGGGTFAVTFDVAFGAAPIVTASYTEAPGAGNGIYITSITSAGCTVNGAASKGFALIAVGARP